MQPPRRRGNASKTPSSTMHERKVSGGLCATMKSLARMFSPPPSQSVVGLPLLWNWRRKVRPPPPMWSMKGMFASCRRAHSPL